MYCVVVVLAKPDSGVHLHTGSEMNSSTGDVNVDRMNSNNGNL